MKTARDFLMIEDDEDDYVLIRDLMSDIFNDGFNLDWERSWADGHRAIEAKVYDACLIDYQLGSRNGSELIRDATARGYASPMILLTGDDSREVDLEAMEAGASDYLVKGQITGALLERSIRYAIEQKKAKDRLATLALTDGLTGIANRNMFQMRLDDAINQRKRTDLYIALLVLDVDHFKEINDTYGHQAGDAVLKGIADRLRMVTRDSDTVARLGGDEFAIIATNIELETGGPVIAQKILESISDPIVFDDREIDVSISIGITMCPPDNGPSDQLLKNADTALYQAKGAGRGLYQFFDKEMNDKRLAQQKLLREIRNAITANEFILYFQPKFKISNNQLVGAEALIRWRHPERGLVPPGDFIPVAESTGLITDIGRWVLCEACAQSVSWRNSGYGELAIAVNISVSELKQADFADAVEQIIEKTNIDPRCLEIEITETMVMDNLEFAVEVLNTLRNLGIRIHMDDFGTGHSSLARLKQLPIDSIKIDRSLVANILDDPRDMAIIKSIITLAENLGLVVVAEGVETAAQLDCLKNNGCGQAQGYFFGRPVHADEFVNLYLKGQSHASNQYFRYLEQV